MVLRINIRRLETARIAFPAYREPLLRRLMASRYYSFDMPPDGGKPSKTQ